MARPGTSSACTSRGLRNARKTWYLDSELSHPYEEKIHTLQVVSSQNPNFWRMVHPDPKSRSLGTQSGLGSRRHSWEPDRCSSPRVPSDPKNALRATARGWAVASLMSALCLRCWRGRGGVRPGWCRPFHERQTAGVVKDLRGLAGLTRGVMRR